MGKDKLEKQEQTEFREWIKKLDEFYSDLGMCISINYDKLANQLTSLHCIRVCLALLNIAQLLDRSPSFCDVTPGGSH